MQYRLFGQTGVKVSPLCLGAMNFGGAASEADSIPIIHAALAAGINFIDTANVYGQGASESVLGNALAGRRADVFLATKVRGKMGEGANDQGLSRRHIIEACEASLRRLKTDTIDLYQAHRPDPDVPIAETLRAFSDLIQAGKVRYIGCSTHPAWQVMEALAASEREHLARYQSEQPPYNLLDRRIENELVPLALSRRLSIIPWAPLAQGVLAGRYQPGAAPAPDSRAARQPGTIYAQRVTPRGIELGAKFAALAREHGKTPGQLALLWCKDQPGITAPIFGPRTMEQLQDVLPVLEMTLSPEEAAACDALNPPGGVVANFHNTAGWMKTPVATN